MTNAITAEDPKYHQLFDIKRAANERGAEIIDDPYSPWRDLRARGPVHAGDTRTLIGMRPAPQLFTVERPHFTCVDYESCTAVLVDNRLFSSQVYYEYFPAKQIGRTILHMGGDEHRQYRGIVQPLFIRQLVESWWQPALVEPIVDELLQTFQNAGRAELNQQLCARLPMHTVTRSFGLPADIALQFRFNLARYMSPETEAGARAEADAACQEVLRDAVRQRREKPGDDIISRMVAAEFVDEDGSRHTLSEAEIFSFCRVILAAGGGTTWRQLGITLNALLANRDQLELVRADRKLIDRAIHESMRWNVTAPVFYRLTTEDTVLNGVEIPEGSIMDVCLGAANRDPSRWSDPDTYDLRRPEQKHVGFAAGPHTCLGMFVAQSEMRVAINTLLDRLPDLRLDPDHSPPKITGGLDQRGVDHLQVLF
jgi:cytochrome P450